MLSSSISNFNLSMRIATKSFLFFAALFLGLEGLARLAFNDTFVGRFDYGYHPTAGFVELGERVDLRSAGGRRFWVQSFSNPKPAGRFRIFTVGDSVARGNAVELAYPHLLGEMLRAQGHNVESINLSVAGYGVRRRLVVLEQALKYQPDLIILHLNHSNEYEDEREWRRAQDAKSWHPSQWLRKSYIIARLDEAKTERLFWKLPTGMRSVREVNDHDAELAAEQHGEQGKVWDRFFRDKTADTVRLLQAKGVPVLLLSKGGLDASRKHLDDFGQDAFIAERIGTGVYMASTRQVFARLPNPDPYFSRDGIHWKPEGHRLMAEALLPITRRAIQVAPSPPHP